MMYVSKKHTDILLGAGKSGIFKIQFYRKNNWSRRATYFVRSNQP
jgi:hypothetical protein